MSEGPEYIPTPEERQSNRERARGGSPQGGGPPGKNWWSRRSTKAKIAIIVSAVIVIAVIASAASNGGKKDTADLLNNNSAQPTDNSSQPSNNGPLVRGTWNPECNQFSAGDKDACAALRVSRVSCQWQDDHVHMTVVFRNTFGAHVTVHMDPIYKLQNAGFTAMD